MIDLFHVTVLIYIFLYFEGIRIENTSIRTATPTTIGDHNNTRVQDTIHFPYRSKYVFYLLVGHKRA